MKTIFTTKRCNVVPLNLKHKVGYIQLHTNPNVMEPIPVEVYSKDQAVASLEEQILNYQNPQPKLLVWAIQHAKTNDFIGTCALVYKSNNEVEIGYRIMETHWQQKYATEVCKELINHAFASTPAKKVVADVNSTNFKSIRILERFMDYKGKTANRLQDTMDLHYGVLRQHWALQG